MTVTPSVYMAVSAPTTCRELYMIVLLPSSPGHHHIYPPAQPSTNGDQPDLGPDESHSHQLEVLLGGKQAAWQLSVEAGGCGG